MPAGDRAFSDFAVVASFVGADVVLALHGEVDIVRAPEFSAFFETIIDRGHRSVVLDLAGLRFMDASGLAVIAQGADRLEVTGGTLAIRTPASMILRLLEITGLARLVSSDPEEPDRHLTPEQSEVRPGGGPPAERAGMPDGVTKFGALRSDEEVIDEALALAVSLARAVVGGADGVSVSLRRRGLLSTVAATNQTVSNMDASQYATGQGPCVDASTVGRWFHAESLESESRWPEFTPRARALGIESILSSPLLVRQRPVGALNIYSRTPSAFTVRDQELAGVFADKASSLLHRADLDVSDDGLSVRFQGALRVREVIAQAQGVLMERQGITESAAYRALRLFSLRNGRPLQERADHIVASTRRGGSHNDD